MVLISLMKMIERRYIKSGQENDIQEAQVFSRQLRKATIFWSSPSALVSSKIALARLGEDCVVAAESEDEALSSLTSTVLFCYIALLRWGTGLFSRHSMHLVAPGR